MMETIGDVAARCSVAVRPGLAGGLLRGDRAVEPLEEYVAAAGGYAGSGAGGLDAEGLLDLIEQSGLGGGGGAAFPLATKARAVRRVAKWRGAPIVVAKGEGGGRASIKARWLLRNRPHLVLAGLRRAAGAVGADRAFVYLSDPLAARSAASALEEAERAGRLTLPVGITVVEPAYVAGEETAAVRAINGGPAKPTDKPPRPFEARVSDRPTLVSNVETLANLPFRCGDGEVDWPAAPGASWGRTTARSRSRRR